MEKRQILYNKILCIAAVILVAILSVISGRFAPSAYADSAEISYTNVMDDLTASEDFNISDYPNNPDDYTLYVEQIAESDHGELFVYVYNPSAKTMPFTAKDISMSTASGNTAEWRLYDLTLLSSDGVFGKYLVNDFTVKDDVVRVYDITEIHRDWNEDVDDPIEGGEINYVRCRVAKRYTAMTTSTGVHYACEATEVIEVIASYAGFTRVKSGVFSSYACDAHFVAFSTDKQMDKLMEADITYYTQDYSYSSNYTFDPWKVITGHGDEQTKVTVSHGEKIRVFDTIAANEQGTFKGDGWFAKRYTWDRIQTVEDFKNTASPDDSVVNSIDGMDWVLRFAETPYSFTSYSSPTGTAAGSSATGTKVSEFTILRLKFETAGVVYNLGVVMDIITADNIPDGGEWGFDFWGGSNSAWERAVKILLAILIFALVVILLWQTGLLPLVIKAVIWIICAPFKAIAACVKGIKNATNKKDGKHGK